MNRNETEACLRILFAVAIADGTVSADEERALAVLAGYDGSNGGMPRVLDVPKEASRIQSAEVRRATFDAAVAIAEVDGRCTGQEHQLLEQLRSALDVTDGPHLEAAEEAWREQLEGPRQRLSAAEVKFLHALSDKRDALSNDAYAALVDELRSEREDILRDALCGAAIRSCAH